MDSWAAQEALRLAVGKEHRAVVRFLVAQGVELGGELGDAVLLAAAAMNDVVLLQLLLDRGMALRFMGDTALAAAARCCSWEALHFLLLAGVSLETWGAQTAFLSAMVHQHLPTLRALEAAGFNFLSDAWCELRPCRERLQERSQISIENAQSSHPDVQRFVSEAQERCSSAPKLAHRSRLRRGEKVL